MDRDDSLQRLKQALRDHHEVLEELESALLEFEESIEGNAPERPEEGRGLGLLAMPELCQELGGWARAGSTGVCATVRSRA